MADFDFYGAEEIAASPAYAGAVAGSAYTTPEQQDLAVQTMITYGQVQEAGLGGIPSTALANIVTKVPGVWTGAAKAAGAASKSMPTWLSRLLGLGMVSGAAYGGTELAEMTELPLGVGIGGVFPQGGGVGGFNGKPPSSIVAYTWDTGTAKFYRLIDGKIAVQRKNGVWKIYRPSRHLVISRNPSVNSLLKADKKIDRMMKALARRAGIRTTTRRKANGRQASTIIRQG